MKILVLGAGAIGGYYGARLIEGGAAVTFMVRPARAIRLAERGLVVRSDLGAFDAKVTTIERADASQAFDIVLLTCKTYDLASALDAVAPVVGGGACVLPLLNGIAVYDALDARFGRDHVMAGVAYIATMLAKDGDIVHMGAVDRIVVGARAAVQRPVAQRFHDALKKDVGVRALSDDIDQVLWDKWVTVCTGAAVTCLMRGTVAEILQTGDGRTVMQRAMAETRAVAAASGHPLSASATQQLEGLLLNPQLEWSASMMRDIGQAAPRIEADGIVGDMLRRAVSLGIDAPILRTAFSHLQVYEIQRRKTAAGAS